MKKLSIAFILFFVINHSSLLAQIKVNASGYVGINNSNPTYRLDVSGAVKFAIGTQYVFFDGSGLYTPTWNVDLGNSTNYWPNLFATSGWFTNAPFVVSDLNYKTNIADLNAMSNKLKLLRPVSYQLKADVEGLAIDKSQNNTQFGFIAQELQKVFPDMVAEQGNGILGIRYTELIPVLVQTLKEQQDQIDLLNERIRILESTLK